MVTAGQRLREERLKKNLSIEEIAKATRIRASFLLAIEKGDYQQLPSATYAYGFVKNYAEYLKLSKREVLALFRREFDEEKTFKVLPEGLTKTEDFPVKKIRLQQTVFILLGLGILFASYMLFQYRYAFFNPPLSLTSPKENITSVTQTIDVAGKTDPNAAITINDKPVPVEANGNFFQQITLFPGKSTIKIEAKSRFGKKTEIQRVVDVKAEE